MDKDCDSDVVNLQSIWMQFCSERNEERKVHLCQLFLFKYYILKNKDEDNTIQTFLSSVPSQLSCYLLQLVYEIICTSVSSQNSEANSDEIASRERVESEFTFLDNKPSTLILNAPSDITAIVSLREFLINGLGRLILEYLHNCPTELITCKRELGSLLINLFPSSCWDNTNAAEFQLDKPMDFKCHIKQFLLIKNVHLATENHIESEANQMCQKKSYQMNCSYNADELEVFCKRRISSDQHAFTIIDILHDLVRTEIGQHLDEKSVTVESLLFALDTIVSLHGTKPFNIANSEIMLLKILSLAIACLNNIYAKEKNVALIGLLNIFQKILKIFKVQISHDQDPCHNDIEMTAMLVTIYILFGLVHNTIAISHERVEECLSVITDALSKKGADSLENSLEIMLNKMNGKRMNDFKEIVDIIILTQNVCRIKNTKENSMKRKKKSKCHKRMSSQQLHCKGVNLSCVVDSILIKTLSLIDSRLQSIVLTNFTKNGVCCCTFAVENIRIVMNASQNNEIERYIYRFLSDCIICTLFSEDRCPGCTTTSSSAEFQKELLVLYIEKYQSIKKHHELTNFLKHILKITTNTTTKILEGIMTAIVLPIFHREIQKPAENMRSTQTTLTCLRVFRYCLVNSRLVTIFFTDEIIQYLRTLIYVPALVQAVCALLNVALNEDTCAEMLEEDRKSISKQLNSIIFDASINSCQLLSSLFVIAVDSNNQLSRDTSAVRKHSFDINNSLSYLYKAGKLNIHQVLALSVTYWELILEQCWWNSSFRSDFFQKFLLVASIEINDEQIEKNPRKLLRFICDTLCCFLSHNKGPERMEQSGSSLETSLAKSIARNNTSITLSDYYIVSLDESFNGESACALDTAGLCFGFHNSNENLNAELESMLSSHSESFDRRTPLIFDCDSSSTGQSFEEVTHLMSASDHVHNELLMRFKAYDNGEIIFDIKNQCRLSGVNKCCEKVVLSTTEERKYENRNSLISSLHTLNSILKTSVSYLFSSVESKSKESTEYSEEVNTIGCCDNVISEDKLKCLITTSNCKRKLLKLFTSALSIMILYCEQGKDKNMQLLIRNLRNLLLPSSKSLWEDVDDANSIIQVLHALLKVAEMTGASFEENGTRFQSKFHKSSSDTSDDTPFNNSTPRLSQPGGTHCAGDSGDQIESDLDISDEETDELTILGTDEGYEADAEILEVSDTSQDERELFRRHNPSSQYRTDIVNEGLCNLVVEILMELTVQCIDKPECWVPNLTQLLKQLSTLRSSLGGSLFLLKGFSKILSQNDNRLKDLQQSILDLITNLCDPDSLAAYFNILAAENPPIDILVQHMSNICNNSINSTPYTAITFPVPNDASISYLGNEAAYENIKQMRNVHEIHEADSIFTRSPCFLPISTDNAKPFGEDGFTISTWVKLHGNLENSKHQKNCEETHIISFGTQQLVVSLFVNEDYNVIVEFCHPSADISPKRSTPEAKMPNPSNSRSPSKDANLSQGKLCRQRRKRKLEISNVSSTSKNAAASREQRSEGSALRQVLHTTTLAIFNSFSSFNLLQNASGHVLHGARIESDSIKLPENKWTHLCISIQRHKKMLNLMVTLDGTVSFPFELPWNISSNSTKRNFEMIAIGDMFPLDVNQLCPGHQFINYSMSTVLVFKRFLPSGILANLTTLGPECDNLIYRQAGSTIPNYGLLDYHLYANLDLQPLQESLKILRCNLILSYSTYEPTSCTHYTIGESGPNGIGKRKDTILYTRIHPETISSLQNATYICGGLSCLLMLFAKTVELTNKPEIQANALNILLRVALTDTRLYTEFVKKDTLSLIGIVIKTNQCSKSLHLLKVILNNACSSLVCAQKNGEIQLTENMSVCVVYPFLIVNVIKRYSDWSSLDSPDSAVMDLLLKCIQDLIHEKQLHYAYNMSQFIKTGLIKELLNLCKIYLVESPNPVYISKTSAALFVDILNTFAGAPPPPSLLDEITKLLLILQKPNECYVTDNRSRFYFLVTSEIPTRQRRIGLTLPSKQIRFSIRNRKKILAITENQFQSRGEMKLTKSEHITSRRPTSPRFNRTNCRMYDLETLQAIANCSGITERKLCVIRWESRERFRKFLLGLKKKQTLQTHFRRNQSRKIMKKKSRKLAKAVDNTNSERVRKTSDNAEDEMTGVKEFDIVHSDEILSLEQAQIGSSRRNLKLSKMDVYQSPGVIAIQDGLFNLLRDYLLILPDSSIEEVLGHYVKLEIILVLANNRSCNIRTAILRLLMILCERLSPCEIYSATKKMYWHHLANQLAIHSVDDRLMETCIQWVTNKPGFSIGFEELAEQDLKIENKVGLNALFAMAIQTIHNTNLATNVFKVIEYIFRTDSGHNMFMIENGLIQIAVKTLQKIYLEVKLDYRKSESSIRSLLTAIAESSVCSSGHINILWELLNILSYYGESNFTKVVYGFRSIQAHILLSLMQMFLQQNVQIGQSIKLKDMHLPGSNLSSSEVRTRFDLIVDRSNQFYVCMSNSYHPSAIEVQLFELLITLSVSGYSRCNSLVSWGLSPTQVLTFKNCVISTLLTKLDKSSNLPTFSCDWKMVKAFLWKYQSLCGMNGDCSPVTKVCKKLLVTENDVWSLDECLDKLELNRANCLQEQKPGIEKAVYKFETIAQACTDSAMSITRTVADLQNSERKHLMILMRQYDESFIYAEWKQVIQRMTHEGAPWNCPNMYPKSWELDDTEGPSRVRTRVRRCVLKIAPKFIMPDYRETFANNQPKTLPLKYLISSYDQHINFSLNAQILFNFPAKFVPVDGEIDGELIVTDEKIFFAATHRCQFFYITSYIDNISEIWIRRYQHQENGLEFFINSNRSFFFVIEGSDDRNMLKEIFADKIVTNVDPVKLMYQWKEGRLTNWEYLMALNQLAGRTYNDLMQYPVFPWILADYKSNCLDLTQKSSYRKLEKPIAVQHDESEQHYITNFTYMSTSLTNIGSWQIKPYHYSSHYSNSGTVLHFLVRIPPYTSYFLRYQDNNFDIPDRTFHSLNTTWNLASKDSPTDVKELIPEFFCLPEMFENFECFNFGVRQNGEVVSHVSLPPWCSNNPRLFVLIHRQALESEMVRKHLHHWIDLIFGYKQTGQPAIDAINVFHPATYAEFNFGNISDPIERQAFQTMIRTYGQMPKQLFKTPHDVSAELNYSPHQPSVLTSVKGLRWGVFTGSPQLEDPKICSVYKQSNVPYVKLLPFENKNTVYGLHEKTAVMLGTDTEFNLISWHHDDSVVRMQPLNENVPTAKPLLYDDPADRISCCGSHCSSNILWFGHKSGKITVYHCTNHDIGKNNRNRSTNSGIKLSYNSAFRKISSKLPSRLEEYESLKDNKSCKYDLGTVHWSGPTTLVRHTDEVTGICISMEFKIAVSIAKDGLAVIWDLNGLNYIRTIDRPSEIRHSPLNIVVISPTLGDIFTVHSIEPSESENRSSEIDEECFEVTEENLDDFVNVAMNFNGMSIMRLHSVNGKYVNHNIQEERILSACYSYIKEGVGVNVIATGFENGIIKLWSSWDLSLIRELVVSQSDIISLTFSTYQHLAVLTKDYIQVWDSVGLLGDTPKFPQFMLHKGSNA